MKKLKLSDKASGLIITADWIFYQVGQNRYFKTDFTTTQEVDSKTFNLAKYGYQVSPYENGEKVVILKNGNTLRCHYQSSLIREFSKDGLLLRELPENMAVMSIYDIAVDKNGHIWTAEPTVHRVAQYDFKTGELLFKVGGRFEQHQELNYPEDIYIRDNFVFISDMGNNRIARLDIEKKTIETYRQFDKPIWEYRIFKGKEYVIPEDGIYEL